MAPRSRFHLPRRTVRLRLTALYGSLFLLSGAGLLAITFALTSRPIATSFVIVGQGGTIQRALPVKALVPPCAVIGQLCPPAGQLNVVAPPHAVRFATGAGGITRVVGQFVTDLPTPAEVHHFLVVSGCALAAMALVSIWLGWVMAGRVLRPLRAMTVTARQISEDNLHQRLAVQGAQDELKDLGDTIDGLLARLEAAFEAQRRFVANASHELRTPLAMMRTSVDVAMGKPDPPGDVRRLAGKLEEGLQQADHLLEGLLLLARAQQGPPGDVTEVSLSDLVESALDANRADIRGLGLSVYNRTTALYITGNATLLRRMVANIIDNAVRHNVAGGAVEVSTQLVRGNRALLFVSSTGHVIDAGRARHLGEPFQRLGAERVAIGTGAGLGLSIVKAIASAHGGSVALQPRPAGGLVVVVDLPAAVDGAQGRTNGDLRSDGARGPGRCDSAAIKSP
ncbi:MAG TPA: HAMP domain-containing sensor histidine kinase [Acidimicrobiales bacterium]|nr:HAMP domain-containing sensor histidine kinase [Acidimicrobiales bacterium]